MILMKEQYDLLTLLWGSCHGAARPQYLEAAGYGNRSKGILQFQGPIPGSLSNEKLQGSMCQFKPKVRIPSSSFQLEFPAPLSTSRCPRFQFLVSSLPFFNVPIPNLQFSVPAYASSVSQSPSLQSLASSLPCLLSSKRGYSKGLRPLPPPPKKQIIAKQICAAAKATLTLY